MHISCSSAGDRLDGSFLRLLPEAMRGSDFLHRFASHGDEGVTAVDGARSYAVRAATRHPVLEHFRVLAFALALRSCADGAPAYGAAQALSQGALTAEARGGDAGAWLHEEQLSLMGELMLQVRTQPSLLGELLLPPMHVHHGTLNLVLNVTQFIRRVCPSERVMAEGPATLDVY